LVHPDHPVIKGRKVREGKGVYSGILPPDFFLKKIGAYEKNEVKRGIGGEGRKKEEEK
jgi:hypothetical protein